MKRGKQNQSIYHNVPYFIVSSDLVSSFPVLVLCPQAAVIYSNVSVRPQYDHPTIPLAKIFEHYVLKCTLNYGVLPVLHR